MREKSLVDIAFGLWARICIKMAMALAIAVILFVAFLGILVFFSKDDIIGRFYAIVLEFLVCYPAIYWYLKSKLG